MFIDGVFNVPEMTGGFPPVSLWYTNSFLNVYTGILVYGLESEKDSRLVQCKL